MALGEVNDAVLADLRARLGRAVAARHDGARVTDLRPLTGGASSLTFVAEVEGAPADEQTIVVKVAPPGLAPVRNRDVLRQARLMRALEGQPRTLAPRTLLSDAGAPPEFPPLLAMDLVAGECVEPVLAPKADRPEPVTVRARYLDAAALLADLHRVSPAEVGLGGEPVVSLADEIDRWTRAFETVSEDLRGDYERCAAALHASKPPALPPVINHGDYRLGNTLCSGEKVMAIIDWEIWSIGDPRVDMTWLTYFTDDAAHPATEPIGPAGTPTSAEVIEAYERARGSALPDLAWFEALTKYKEAAATALLIKRGRKAGTLQPSMQRMAPALPKMIEEALTIVGG